MALNPQQFQQLPMFMSGQEIMDQVRPRDFISDTPWGAAVGWRRKIEDAETRLPKTTKSIREEGVQEPVHVTWGERMYQPELINGHHRVALSHQADPERLIPVEHSEYYPLDLTKRMRGWQY